MPYDMLGQLYDTMIDWPARLARDIPALERLFASVSASVVVDCGCGSGEHALALARDGFTVLGIDAADEMVHLAESKARNLPRRPEFMCRALDDLPDPQPLFDQPYDVIYCIGNTLPHVQNPHQVRKHVRLCARFISTHGLYILQMLNYQTLAVGEHREYPERILPSGGRLVRRQERFREDRSRLIIEFTEPDNHHHVLEHDMLIWSADEIIDLFTKEGFHIQHQWSSLDGAPFDPSASPDMVLIFQKN